MAHMEGSAWRLNECSSCVCLKSGIQCYHEPCQNDNQRLCKSGRFLKIKGKCCPICVGKLIDYEFRCLILLELSLHVFDIIMCKCTGSTNC